MKIINILTPYWFKIIWDDTASKMHLTQVTSVTCTSDWQPNLTHYTCMICDIFNTKVNTSLTLCSTHIYWLKGKKDGWMDERCFRPLLCTVKAELGRGQHGLMRWIWDETLPQSSINHLTIYSTAHRATKWASGHPQKAKRAYLVTVSVYKYTI